MADDLRSEIYRLYEDTIGPIPRMTLAEELSDAASKYQPDWIRDAFKEAAVNNARNWAYVRAILSNWAEKGRPNRERKANNRSADGRPAVDRKPQAAMPIHINAEDAARLWQSALDRLRPHMSAAAYETWLGSTSGVSLSKQEIVVEVETEYAANWLGESLIGLMERAVSEVAEKPMNVSLQVSAE